MIRDLTLEGENQFKVSQNHTHSADGTLVGTAVAMNTLKRTAAESLDRGRNVVAKLSENMSVSVAAALPQPKSMIQAVRRSRDDQELPKQPTSLYDLVLPDDLIYVDDVRFLQYDSGAGSDRILIFSTERNLQLLKRASVMAMDGTFDIVPPLFSQLYTLQG